MSHIPNIPKLYVEGKDDISVINALLYRHGVNTERGQKFLFIKDLDNAETVLATMPDAIKTSTSQPVGFVLDVDVALANRWQAVCSRLQSIGVQAPQKCPSTGFVDQLPEYPHPFGVWLMPDCTTDDAKLEHLCESLIREGDPLWALAKASVQGATKAVDDANNEILVKADHWKRFREVDLIKAEIHTWLAWQHNPGVAMGAAINDGILRDDSSQAKAFLGWLKTLFGLPLS